MIAKLMAITIVYGFFSFLSAPFWWLWLGFDFTVSMFVSTMCALFFLLFLCAVGQTNEGYKIDKAFDKEG